MTPDELLRSAELAEMLLKAKNKRLIDRDANAENELILKACLMFDTTINFELSTNDRNRSNNSNRSGTAPDSRLAERQFSLFDMPGN